MRGYAPKVASTQPAPRPDQKSRLALATLTMVGLAVLLWLVASLAAAAFG